MERRDSHVVWTPCFRRPAAIWPSGRTSLPVSARETAEIVMCVPSLVPSLATQIKSSSLLLLNQVGDQAAPASCRLIPPNGGGGAEGLIGHAG